MFSDDVRHESSGKTTLVGVYAGEMTILSGAPALLPQLCVTVYYRDDIDALPKDIVVIVFKQGTANEELAKFELTLPPPTSPDGTGSNADNKTFAEVRLEARITPFAVTEDCRISVRAYQGEDEIRLGSLSVKLGTPANLEAATQP